MGIFGKSKVDILLDRLFGKYNVDCMNVQAGSGGLIAEVLESVDKEMKLLDKKIDRICKTFERKKTVVKKPAKKK